jgi:hypothetical protein
MSTILLLYETAIYGETGKCWSQKIFFAQLADPDFTGMYTKGTGFSQDVLIQ